MDAMYPWGKSKNILAGKLVKRKKMSLKKTVKKNENTFSENIKQQLTNQILW